MTPLLRLKILVSLLAIIVSIVIVGVIVLSQMNQMTHAILQSQTQMLGEERISQLESEGELLHQKLISLSNDINFRNTYRLLMLNSTDATAISNINTLFDTWLKATPSIKSIGLLSIDGSVLATFPITELNPAANGNIAFEAIRQALAVKQQEFYLGQLSAADSQAALPLKQGPNITGYIVVHFNPSIAIQGSKNSIINGLRAVGVENSAMSFYVIEDSPSLPIFAPSASLMLLNGNTAYKTQLLDTNQGTVRTIVSPLTGTNVLIWIKRMAHVSGWFVVESYNPLLTASVNNASNQSYWVIPAIGLVILVTLIVAAYWERQIIRPIIYLNQLAQTLSKNPLTEVQPQNNLAKREDELGTLYRTLLTVSQQSIQSRKAFESRLYDSIRDMEATHDIGQIIANIRNLDILMNRVIQLILSRFPDIYHAQIFLLDDTNRYAVLRASTGEAGKKMLVGGHRLPSGGQSTVGQAVQHRKPIVVMNTSGNTVHRFNPLLPETKAEAAIPLIIGDETIGALDLQSRRPDAFSETDLQMFQSVADQISIAISNVRLLEQLQSRLNEIEALNRNLQHNAWSTYIATRRRSVVSSDEDEQWSPLQRQAIQSGQIVEKLDNDKVIVALPILLRNQAVGAVECEFPAEEYHAETRILLSKLTENLASSADNIRLYEQSQQVVGREQLLNEIANKLNRQNKIADILETAVVELGKALQVPRTAIRINPSIEGTNQSS